MTQLVGTNEGVAYVKKMVNQTSAGKMEYPSGTNMRGDTREHHASGDMVGRAEGDMVECKKAFGGAISRGAGAMSPRFGAMTRGASPHAGMDPREEMPARGRPAMGPRMLRKGGKA